MKSKKAFRRSRVFLILLAMSVSMIAGCGTKSEDTKKAAETEKAEEAQTEEDFIEDLYEEISSEGYSEEDEEASAAFPDISVDYKSSEIYSKKDMNAAIEKILEEFNTWEGCVLYDVCYTDDQKCIENLDYINYLAVDQKYDECIVFTSDFHSPVEGGGAWEPDYDYENYEWDLGRVSGGEWELINWGY